MKISLFKVLVALGALTVASACTQETSVTRNMTFQEIGQERALTRLSRQFMAETPYTVNFAFDKYDLDAEAIARLDEQAAWILAHPEAKFSVYGHTDLMGGNAYNQNLGMERAQMVVDYLIGKGVSAGRLEVKMTLGEEMPLVNVVAPNEANRRATTFVSGWLREERGERRKRSASRNANLTPVTETTGETGCIGSKEDCGAEQEEQGEGQGEEGQGQEGQGEEGQGQEGQGEEGEEEREEEKKERRPCQIAETCERPEAPSGELSAEMQKKLP